MLDQRRAIQMYLENRDKFPGMSQSDAIGLIRRSGGLPAAAAQAAPAQAEPAANMQVPTAAQVAPPPAPAPEAGAPAPQQNISPQQIVLNAYNAANPATPATPIAKDDYAAQIEQNIANAERSERARRAAIAEAAKISPDIQKAITDRETRISEELLNVDKDRQQAVWMAVAQAGMKMAQSQSPYFMQALASGMEAGLNGYNDSKAKAAEKKARLQDVKEELVFKKADLLDRARSAALAEDTAAAQGLAARQSLKSGEIKNLLGEKTIGDAIEAAGLENKYKKAAITKIFHDMAHDDAVLAIARAKGSGGSGGPTTSQLNAYASSLVSENNHLRDQMSDPLLSAADKKQIKAKIDENDRAIKYARSLQGSKFGISSGFRILGPG